MYYCTLLIYWCRHCPLWLSTGNSSETKHEWKVTNRVEEMTDFTSCYCVYHGCTNGNSTQWKVLEGQIQLAGLFTLKDVINKRDNQFLVYFTEIFLKHAHTPHTHTHIQI